MKAYRHGIFAFVVAFSSHFEDILNETLNKLFCVCILTVIYVYYKCSFVL